MHLLSVPFESQLDNSSGSGYRECFSSSAAMLAKFWGKVSTDDEYNAIRQQFGDTTSAQAQLTALRSLGLQSYFWTNGCRIDLERELLGGRPVAVGWLHQGRVTAPTGGGHWSVAVGFNVTHVAMNDPNGEALVESGGYTRNTNGACVRYSWRNWLPRWEVEGPRTGWYLTCSR